MTNTIGFIILRHVNNEYINKLWIYCYNCIRKFYPENTIFIIDDNSNYNFITNEILYNTISINSEYPNRGELLFYYYYLKYKFFDIAIMLHDSVFINNYIDINNIDTYKFIWTFTHEWDNIIEEQILINLFNNLKLLEFYNNKNMWLGCFGCMTIIKHDFLKNINDNFNINLLINYILNRNDRCNLERILACIFQYYDINNYNNNLYGNIHNYIKWELTFDEINNYTHLPLIKVWVGR